MPTNISKFQYRTSYDLYPVSMYLISAVEFIHGNFSEFLKIPRTSSQDFFESASNHRGREFEGSSTSDELSKLLLELLKVNGSPLLDITLDISPRNSSQYVGVIRVPGKAAILPRLTYSRRDFALFSRRWVRKLLTYLANFPFCNILEFDYTYLLTFT